MTRRQWSLGPQVLGSLRASTDTRSATFVPISPHPVKGCLGVHDLAFLPESRWITVPIGANRPVAGVNNTAPTADQARKIRYQTVNRADALAATRRTRLMSATVAAVSHGDNGQRLVTVDWGHDCGAQCPPLTREEVMTPRIADPSRSCRDEADVNSVGEPGYNRGIAQGDVVAIRPKPEIDIDLVPELIGEA